MEYSPSKMKEKLNEKSFNFKKKFGQNFIIDENVIKNIISKSEIDKDTLVIEIGAGAGSLTSYLGKYSKNVIAYEIDKTIKPVLEENIENNTKIIYDDFLKRNIDEDIKKYEYSKLYVVANLPYYITTPIIIKLIKQEINIDKIVVMVQKEVGDRFRAKPGTKQYNALTVLLDYYYNVEKILDVSKNVFLPKPNVDSIVVSFTKKQQKALKNQEIFFKLIKDAFKQKRKTLKNNLKGYDLEKISKILDKYGMDLSIRAENIPTEIFVEIANNL